MVSPRQRRWILSAGGVATIAIVALAIFVLLPEDAPRPAAQPGPAAPGPAPAADVADDFLTAFARGDAAGAGALTDDPEAATRQLAAVRQGLAPTEVKALRSVSLDITGDTATVPFDLTWTLGPQRVWSYASTLPLARNETGWRVRWTPALVHPKLTAETGLARRNQAGQPAVLDRDGAPLLVWQDDGAKAADPALAPLLTPAMGRVAGGSGGPGGWHVALVDAAGTELDRLGGADGEPGEPAASTLSVPAQKAAQAAVDTVAQPAFLVAIQPSTGEILAVAQNSAAGADPRALNGLYPPGSTFKIATATAVLKAGTADVGTVLPCPGSDTIGTRTIRNADFELGDVPLRTAFARSCNTTFGRLALDLPPEALSGAATELGLNADFDIPGITTEAGAVRPAAGRDQRVEDGIGQGAVQASPFGLALMSATVASGRAVTPTMWRDRETTVIEAYSPPPRAVLDRVRSMMREVVTAGTARALAGRGQVFGKTGTAQFGDGVHAHGWFTGYRGDVAFAVLVESAETAAPAVAVSGAFLDGLA
jgi:hypothetical protein